VRRATEKEEEAARLTAEKEEEAARLTAEKERKAAILAAEEEFEEAVGISVKVFGEDKKKAVVSRRIERRLRGASKILSPLCTVVAYLEYL